MLQSSDQGLVRVPVLPGGRRVNTADVILAAIDQSGGKLRVEDFPPPCGDPNCATIGYLFKLPHGSVIFPRKGGHVGVRGGWMFSSDCFPR